MMSGSPQSAPKTCWTKRLCLLMLVAVPALALLLAIARFWVNVPYLDEWGHARVFYELENHTLTPWTFFKQHNDHRMALPRLIYVGVSYLFGGDVRAQMMVTFGLACLVSVNFFVLSRAVFKRSVDSALVLLLFANLLIFSPVQYENWLWGFQSCMVLPFACVTTCLVILVSRIPFALKFVLCVLLCAGSSLSLANGMVAWVAVLPAMVFHGGGMRNGERSGAASLIRARTWVWVAVWIVAAALFALAFAWNYSKVAGSTDPIYTLEHPFATIGFMLVLLGSPLTFNFMPNLEVPMVVGAVIGLLLVAETAYVLWFRSNQALWDQSVIWLSLGIQSVGSGVLMAIGRVGNGVAYASSSRYTTASVITIISLIYLSDAVLRDLRNRFPQRFSDLREARVATGFLTAVFCLHLGVAGVIGAKWHNRRRDALRIKTIVTYANVARFEPRIITEASGLDPQMFLDFENAMDRQGLLHPSVVRSDLLPPIKESPDSGSVQGGIDTMKTVGETLQLKGWAILPGREEPADGVLFCWSTPGGQRHIIKATLVTIPRPDIVNAIAFPYLINCGWAASIPHALVPPEATEISAWAYDASENSIHPLPMLK